MAVLKQYQGPIPPPELLADYSNAIENGAERVFALIESEASHIQSQEKTALAGQLTILKRGQIFAFVVTLISLISAAFTVHISVGLAIAMVTAGIGTLAVAFLGMLASPSGDEKKTQKGK